MRFTTFTRSAATLAEGDRVALMKLKGAAPFEPMGRPMKEYVVVPASVVATPKALRECIERGHRYALTLPAKSATKLRPATKAAATSTTRKQATAKKTTAKKTAAKRTTARR